MYLPKKDLIGWNGCTVNSCNDMSILVKKYYNNKDMHTQL